MRMIDNGAQMVDVHDRMPVILRREDWTRWAYVTVEDAFGLCRTGPEELVTMLPISHGWLGGCCSATADRIAGGL